MTEGKNRFLKYLPLLLDALRSKYPQPVRPPEAQAWIRSKIEVDSEDLSRFIENGKQSIFENDVHWARFYLAKAKLIDSSKRGYWGLTETGFQTHLTQETTWDLYVQVRDANRSAPSPEEETTVAPVSEGDADIEISYWLAGALWNWTEDQLPRFLDEGIWENGYDKELFDLVKSIQPGDRIAIKSSFVRKHNLPFDVGGKSVSVMKIKAAGTVLENLGDGKRIRVAWDRNYQPRDWYFFTYRTTLVRVDTERPDAQKLIDFAFGGRPQDYAWFLKQPYWVAKYGGDSHVIGGLETPLTAVVEEGVEVEEETTYTVESIVGDGCFLPVPALQQMLKRWKIKKNLILQGPPGTGKTWLAKRLGFAMVGSSDREATRSRLRIVQFHPSLAYEDFVRGWRPNGDGKLMLQDGILMQCIDAALSEPDMPFVLVIEEINRGNPAQIFGEMLTLLEDTKRNKAEAIELAYSKGNERIHIPENLFVIGTMNIADRSLAIVDLALRRRFAFVDLEPALGQAWRDWCTQRGMATEFVSMIETRVSALNDTISSAPSLGKQFRLGHSYVTPGPKERIEDSASWYRARVESEIAPLLDEYWYDSPEHATGEKDKLLAGLV